ncbi:ATP-binding cassette domain-containing protein [Amycolatopsis cihanbeyliensis]|uniref:ABC-2 type transport system ATP-binding protein n=1 Tax=Amycolatopsis cihanbeyliensis TaxID=1128664 RepID=A0A542DR73_AMYCI|nr:ATP-binding cassette domain-containing protein [Amycolatopsis cihanbeyliensis]TQJ05536.1 ABC-2 type transport system ATP-binding protein [Amycolatopsis cihanbeyliensis]
MRHPRIEVAGLGKDYAQVTALTGVNLRAEAGAVLAVLGHNGAGKTTLIDILGTRTRPTAGSARVCGFDVVTDGHEVRRHIGMTGQFVAVDDNLSARGNLVLIARLLGASTRQAKARAVELVESFGLAEAADRPARTYSGGMRRRLDLAAGLVGAPEVLFLDEPTTGLDPVSRSGLWEIVTRLAAAGTTVVLTTQYLEEADRLADQVIVLAMGRIVAEGTPERLKAGIGRRTATLTFADPQATRHAACALERLALRPVPDERARTVTAPVAAAGEITGLVRTLDRLGIGIADLTVTEPTLDDVYLSLHRTSWAGHE